MDYGITWDGRSVGKAQLVRQGLYYRVICRCDISGEKMLRLEVSCGGKKLDLGTLIPRERGFGLDTRFPVNRLGEGEMTFRLRSREDTAEHRKFVPVNPEEPFAYLRELRHAVLEIRDGQLGVSISGEESIYPPAERK